MSEKMSSKQEMESEWNSFFQNDDLDPEKKISFYDENAATYDQGKAKSGTICMPISSCLHQISKFRGPVTNV